MSIADRSCRRPYLRGPTHCTRTGRISATRKAPREHGEEGVSCRMRHDDLCNRTLRQGIGLCACFRLCSDFSIELKEGQSGRQPRAEPGPLGKQQAGYQKGEQFRGGTARSQRASETLFRNSSSIEPPADHLRPGAVTCQRRSPPALTATLRERLGCTRQATALVRL